MLPILGRLRKAVASPWIRGVVSLTLIAVVAFQLDLASAAKQLSRCNVGWLALAVAALLVALGVGALRWQQLLTAAGVNHRLSTTARIYAIGAFATNFLPTGFGGDAVRIWLAGTPGRRGSAAATVIVDRVTLLFSAIVLAWLAFAIDHDPVPYALSAGLLAVTLASVGTVAVVFLGGRILASFGGRLPLFVCDVRAATVACFRGLSLPGRVLALGLLYEGLTFASVWLVSKSLALEVPFSVIAMVVPTVLILTALPISIAGYGVREGSYVALLHQTGVSTTNAVLLSLLSTAVYAVSTLPGAAAMLHRPGEGTPVWRRHLIGKRAPTGIDAR
jgi:glycosyltransferase 2 family protein